MGLNYLLDTNVLSEPVRKLACPRLLSRLAHHDEELATAATAWDELRFGAERLPPSRKRRAIEAYLEILKESLPVLPFDRRAAEWIACERARLAGSGRTPPYPDGQIAAVAAVNNLVLVTRNVNDFASFRDLRVVDWAVS